MTVDSLVDEGEKREKKEEAEEKEEEEEEEEKEEDSPVLSSGSLLRK